MVPLLVALLTGCFSDRVQCTEPDQVIAEAGGDALTCGDTEVLIDWLEVLAARPVSKQRSMAQAGLARRFERDPQGTRVWLADRARDRAELVAESGFDGAAKRSHAVWQLVNEQGPILPSDGALYEAADKAIAVWNTDDEDELALTEADIEAWILYGSLCRQLQGAGVLRISVADRVGVYATVGERWTYGSRTERVALASLGPFWHHVKNRWEGASYEKQQAWAKAAPMPPPMTATSLGYLQAILEGDLVGHGASIHGQLGPLSMDRR